MQNIIKKKTKVLSGLIGLALSASLVGCANTSKPNTFTNSTILQDYLIESAETGSEVTLQNLATELKDADVIFIGEYHTHSASHLLQAQLVQSLYQQNNDLIISMEQFTRDKQSVVDEYLAGKIGEQTLIKDGDAWDNYQSDYRPLVEFARINALPVIAANTPITVVRCVAKKGPDYINSFNEEHRTWVAKDITTSSKEYQQKFAAIMGGHGKSKKVKPAKPSNSFYAQLARDNTMAESIFLALKQNPDSQVIHMNGAFHSDYALGTVDALKRLNPELNIKVLSPHFVGSEKEWDKGDYLYTIQSMPTRYVKKENQHKAIAKMMKKRKSSSCEL